MKKKYEKPLVMVEHYKLSQTIASCVVKISYNDGGCVWNDENSTAEMKDMIFAGIFAGGCTLLPAYGDTNENGSCYMYNANGTFSS